LGMQLDGEKFSDHRRRLAADGEPLDHRRSH
jgi:hypothetical protein